MQTHTRLDRQMLFLCLLLDAMVPLIMSSASGEFPIRRSSVMTSWQSSFGDGQTCFYNRSETDEASVLSDPSSSFRFFHSAGKHEADDGFHWFAVQLNEPLLIKSVTVKGREDNSPWLFNRVIGIEIWTSNSSCFLFSGDHCNSEFMSTQFQAFRHAWRLCGVINRALGSINSGENITVPCDSGIGVVNHLLLRKNISDKNDLLDDDVMSFSDLMLHVEQSAHRDPERPSRYSFTTSFLFGFSAAIVSVALPIAVLALLGVFRCTFGQDGFNAVFKWRSAQPELITMSRNQTNEPQEGPAEQPSTGAEYENSYNKLETAQGIYVT